MQLSSTNQIVLETFLQVILLHYHTPITWHCRHHHGNNSPWMARQLCAQGDRIALLAMFDTYNWSRLPGKSLTDRIRFFVQRIEFHGRNFLLLGPRAKSTFVLEKARVARRRLKARITVRGASFPLIALRDANDRAAMAYIPQVYSGRAINFQPIRQYSTR